MAATLDEIQIKISQDSKSASKSIDALINSLEKLGKVSDLSSVASNIASLSESLGNLRSTAEGFNIGNVAKELRGIPKAIASFNDMPVEDVQRFSTLVQTITDIASPLAKEMETLSGSFKDFVSSAKLVSDTLAPIPQVAENAKKKLKDLNEEAEKGKNKWEKVPGSLTSMAKKLGTLSFVGKYLKDSVAGVSQYIQTLNTAKTVMGSAATGAENLADKLNKVLMLNKADVMEFQSTLQTLFTGFGNTSKDAQLMGQNLTQLSYDMAAFYKQLGGDPGAGMEKLRLAMAGTIEPLQRLGYALKEADLKAVAARQGLDVNVRNLNSASKSMLRYIAVMEQSTRVQGYLAQSYDSPTTALLVYKQAMKDLSNEIGKVFLPLVMATIPYVQALVKSIVNMIKGISNFLGIELPTIKGWDEAQEGLAGISDEAEETGKAIKRAFTMGIDELNVFDSSTNGVVGGLRDITGMLDLSKFTYDMTEGFEFKNLDDMDSKFQSILTTVKTIGLGILAWKLSNGLLDSLSELTGLSKLENLKLAAKLTLTVTGFALEFEAAKAIGKGDANAAQYIQMAIGSALGIAGTVALVGGAAGWIIGITAALAIALTGISIGFNQSVDDAIKEEFYAEGGTITITELSEDFEELMNQITHTNDAVIDGGKKIEEYGGKAKTASEDIDRIATALNLGYESANINIPKIQEKFQELATNTKNLMDETYDNIMLAISGSLKQALIDAGADVPKIVAEIQKIKGETDTTYDELMKKYDELSEKMQSGKGDASQYAEELLNIATQMQEISGQVDPVKGAFSDVDDAILKINWESEEAKNNAFEVLKNSAKSAKDNVDEFTKTLTGNLELLEKQGVGSETINKISSAILTVSDEQRKKIDEETVKYANILQNSLISSMQDQFDKAKDEYSKLNFGQRFLSTIMYGAGEEGYTRSVLDKYRKDYITPITGELQDIFDEVGTKGSTWAGDASQEIIDSLFKTDIPLTAQGVKSFEYQSSLEKEISKVLDNVETSQKTKANSAGKSIDAGLANGIDENCTLVSDAMKKMIEGDSSTDGVINYVLDRLGIHSPSTVFAEYGKYIDEGFANGITDNTSTVTGAMEDMLNSLLSKTETFIGKMRDAMNSFLKEFAKSMASIEIEDGNVSYSKIPKITIPGFRNGGTPRRGEYFYAREDGMPEMVGRVGRQTTVMNNGQIADTMAESMVRAMSQNEVTSEPTVIENKLYLDGEVVYTNQEKIKRSKGYSFGLGAFANV